jgi:hypothetical protein
MARKKLAKRDLVSRGSRKKIRGHRPARQSRLGNDCGAPFWLVKPWNRNKTRLGQFYRANSNPEGGMATDEKVRLLASRCSTDGQFRDKPTPWMPPT